MDISVVDLVIIILHHNVITRDINYQLHDNYTYKLKPLVFFERNHLPRILFVNTFLMCILF